MSRGGKKPKPSMRERKRAWSARGSLCPICKRNFRDPDSCPHTIGEVEDWFDDAIIREAVDR